MIKKLAFYPDRTRNQCGKCDRVFGGITAFERHRTGTFGDPTDPRRCRTRAEMRSLRLTQAADGCWSMPAPTATRKAPEGVPA